MSRILFKPEQLYNWSDAARHAHAEYPVTRNSDIVFPFPPPPVYDRGPGQQRPLKFGELRAKTLIGSPLRTAAGSCTIPTASVMALGAGGLATNQLRIKHCSSFLTHLEQYAQGPVPAAEPPAAEPPAAEPPAAEPLDAEPPAVEPPAAELPAAEPPAAEPPAAEPPAAEPLAVEPPAAAPPAAELPAAEPAQAQQAGGGAGALAQQPPSSWSEERTVKLAELPSRNTQATVLDALAAHYLVQLLRGTTSVNCESGIAVEFHKQVLDIINAWLRTRYNVTGATPAPENTSRWKLPSTAPHNNPVPLKEKVPYPRWSATAPSDSKKAFMSKLLHHPSQAVSGVPDVSLYVLPNLIAAIAEVKTYWSVSKLALKTRFKAIARPQEGGKIPWTTRSASPTDLLMVQIWGELCATECRLGLFTNGEIVMFYAKTDDDELTFSNMISWESPKLYTTLMGFSLAAADAILTVLPKPKEKRDADAFRQAVLNEMAATVNRVCPATDRQIAFPDVLV